MDVSRGIGADPVRQLLWGELAGRQCLGILVFEVEKVGIGHHRVGHPMYSKLVEARCKCWDPKVFWKEFPISNACPGFIQVVVLGCS